MFCISSSFFGAPGFYAFVTNGGFATWLYIVPQSHTKMAEIPPITRIPTEMALDRRTRVFCSHDHAVRKELHLHSGVAIGDPHNYKHLPHMQVTQPPFC